MPAATYSDGATVLAGLADLEVGGDQKRVGDGAGGADGAAEGVGEPLDDARGTSLRSRRHGHRGDDHGRVGELGAAGWRPWDCSRGDLRAGRCRAEGDVDGLTAGVAGGGLGRSRSGRTVTTAVALVTCAVATHWPDDGLAGRDDAALRSGRRSRR